MDVLGFNGQLNSGGSATYLSTFLKKVCPLAKLFLQMVYEHHKMSFEMHFKRY